MGRRALPTRITSLMVFASCVALWIGSTPAVGDSAARAARAATEGQLSGPVTGGAHGFPQTSAPVDLAAAGYVEHEYFLAGTATAYRKQGTWTENGKWAVHADSTAPYQTRILVRRPAKASDFNGTVVVEWLNVSSKTDVDVDFGFLSQELLRGGYAWVGVSAQEAGIDSTGGGQFGPGALGLRAWDPERYGSLEHPGDQYSYDIFSQAGRAIRTPKGVNPLPGFKVEHLIADGESQSAFRMVTYTNAVQPVANVYDGILIHSRGGDGAPISAAADGAVPTIARVRTDLRAPVFQVLTETDQFGLHEVSQGTISTFPDSRQPDTRLLRTWEIAGTAHADADYLRALSVQGKKQFSGFLDLSAVFDIANNGPQKYVMRDVLRLLRDWVATGSAPPHEKPLETADGAIVRDAHGNALGGVRTPQLDVPIATLTGEGNSLIGKTVPFTPEVLASLYPSHDAYVEAFTQATKRAVAAKVILKDDAADMIDDAKAAKVG
jgi:hypothetical protein